jgi:hypothetical protein
VAEGTADVAEAGAEDAGPATRLAAAGGGENAAAASCPVSMTTRAMTAPTTASAAPTTAAPERKLMSSNRP